MLKLYYSTAPNPAKVVLFLEEAGLPYEVVPVDTRKGQQHEPAFKALNPNAKVPVLVDGDAVIFDSSAIVLYLAQKSGQFGAANSPQAQGEMLSWLMFVASGIGPFSGQAVHFRHYAPEPVPYALNRYDFEAWRHWEIINERLSTRRYMVGDAYSIVDMSVWGWARVVPFVLGGPECWARLPHVKRLLDEINARPAAQRTEAVKTRFTFKTEMDAEARRAMFPQNERLANE